MKIIKSSNKISLDILVDDHVYTWAHRLKWYVDHHGYASTIIFPFGTGRRTQVFMHRAIMCEPIDVVDHINFNKLDNREINLRTCSIAQNVCHRPRSTRGVSKYLGVYYKTKDNKWIARIRYNKKQYWLGSFKDEIDAARAYNVAALLYHKKFATLNPV